MIEISHLRIAYPGSQGNDEAVRDVSLQVKDGIITALVGESGSGKSTIAMAILSLLPSGTAVSGNIRLGGKELLGLTEEKLSAIRWEKIALIPQGAMNSMTPVLSVGKQIREVLSFHKGLHGEKARRETGELLEKAGLDASVAGRYPHELSGGQRQRATIAMALACDPSYLLADEPTTALDVITQGEIISTLSGIVKASGMGMLLITHDLPLATSVAAELYVMKDGRIEEHGPTEKVIGNPSGPHTRELIAALTRMEGGYGNGN